MSETPELTEAAPAHERDDAAARPETPARDLSSPEPFAAGSVQQDEGEAEPYCLRVEVFCSDEDQDLDPANFTQEKFEFHLRTLIRGTLPMRAVPYYARYDKAKAILFFGRRSLGEGLVREEAERCAQALPPSMNWLMFGPRVRIFAEAIPLAEGKREIRGGVRGRLPDPYRFRLGPQGPAQRDPSPDNLTSWVTADGTVRLGVAAAQAPAPTTGASATHDVVPVGNNGAFELVARPFGLRNRAQRLEPRDLYPAAPPQPTPARRPTPPEDLRRLPPSPLPAMDFAAEEATEAGEVSDSGTEHSYATAASGRRRTRTRRQRRLNAHAAAPQQNETLPRFKVQIPTYKGEVAESDVSYEAWRHDVESHREIFQDDARLLPHVKASLKGDPGNWVRTFPLTYSLAQILAQLDQVYRPKRTYEQVSHELHNLRAKESESVGHFGMRISTLANKMISLSPVPIPQLTLELTKVEILFNGLKPEFQTSLQYLRDGQNPGTYNRLLAAARDLERRAQRNQTRSDHSYKPKATGGFAGGALHPSRKLKGSSVTVKSGAVKAAEEESDEDQEGADVEAAPPAEPVSAPESMDPYIFSLAQHFAATKGCFCCEETDHLVKDCPYVKKAAEGLKGKGGTARQGQSPPKKDSVAKTDRGSSASARA